MKKIFSLLALLTLFSLRAQDTTPPDYAAIQQNVTSSNSPYFFNKLFKKYQDADTNMSLDEKRHLYYGYTFTGGYMPFSRTQAEKDLFALLTQKDPGVKEYEQVIEYTTTVLENYPFSLRMKDYRIYCFKELGRYDEAAKETAQKEIIIDAVLSSGDGITKESSIYVVNPVNEYEFISLLGFEYGGAEQLLENKYDYMALNENSYEQKGIYFNVAPCINALDFSNTQAGLIFNSENP
jgi:hypothetical protein